MAKTALVLLGLVVLALRSWPAVALPVPPGPSRHGLPDVSVPMPLESRAGVIGDLARARQQRTLSGTLIRQSAATTSWFLYPGACVERALGTWSAKTAPVADSLQPTAGFPNSSGYIDNQPDIAGGDNTIAYTRADLSLSEMLWHLADAAVDPAQRPSSGVIGTPNGIIDGSRMLWCGKYQPNWTLKVGYPNLTYQILYIDTGAHGASTYDLTFQGNIAVELAYDHLYIIGGGGSGQADHADPLQNSRSLIDDILGLGSGGPHGDSELLVTFTGSIQSPQFLTAAGQVIEGAGSGQPSTVSYSITIDGAHRALYVVLTSDCLFSNEDGLWWEGAGPCMDLVATTEAATTVFLYDDQAAGSAVDPFLGRIIVGTYGVAGCISARVPRGQGELWQLAPGNENVTNDACSLQKQVGTDLFFEGGDPNTNLAVNMQFNAIVSCVFPIPPGTASVIAMWNAYVDLPVLSGYVQNTEYRYYRGGAWSNWLDTSVFTVTAGAIRAWTTDGDELAEAAQADSVQLRWILQCIPVFTPDRQNCASAQSNALLYDDFRLEIVTGTPAPAVRSIAPAQSTFIDGTIKGTNCQTVPCWPGPRGTDLGLINDNWNSTQSAVYAAITSALRKNGMGVNWRRGFDLSIDGGNTVSHTNGAYNPAYDFPRMIFRLFDPATKTWSPFDSTELIADAVTIFGPDTTLINSDFRIDWPPYDKLETGASLPVGFGINGVTSYAGLRFLPRGTRMQYYFKAVDINGGVTYAFTANFVANEVEDLPALPGGSIKAPDIIEFRVLPGVYPAGPPGSLLAGRTNTPILNLDGPYRYWFGYDPVTQALRGLGVRADRYRLIRSGATGIGGHNLPENTEALPAAFPNYLEYPIVDSLAAWYRIIIQSGHVGPGVSIFSGQDAALVEQWWRHDTGVHEGDRCIFLSGDNEFDGLLNVSTRHSPLQINLARQVFGVGSATNSWSGTATTPYPTIDDRFAAGSAGPGPAAPGAFTYPVDGGCPGENRFDALVKVADTDAANVAFFPGGQVAAVAHSHELDTIADKDRSKALAYGFSIQFIRDPSYGPTNANYRRSGVENRMRVLYKFLTGCRGPRTPAPDDTGKCWPCPSPGSTLSLMQADWAGQASGFQTGAWGPLYPIQAAQLVTAAGEPAPEAAPHVDVLEQNRPNPFNPETVIPYSIGKAGRVVIRVFDVAGRRVRTLVDGIETAGTHVVRWNGKTDRGDPVASGVYFYRIAYPSGRVAARKLAILR